MSASKNLIRASIARSFAVAVGLVATLTLALPATAQVPGRVPLQGTLYALDGTPIDGTLPVDFTLYADAGGLDTLWSDTMNVPFIGGIFTAYLGASEPIDPIVFAHYPQVFVGVTVDGDTEMELFPLATAPYAAMAAYAGDANTLDGFSADDIVAEAVAASDSRFADAAHAHGWGEVTGIPAGFSDGVDDVLTEVDVDAMVADNGFLTSVSWGILAGIPAGFSDGIDNDTQLNEGQVDDMVADNGFLTSVSWGGITGIPGGFADGVDQDTQLTEVDVDAMVADNGFLTAVSWGMLSGVPAGFADGVDHNTQLSESQVDSYANNNGYATAGRAVRTGSCALTGYVNSWDGVMNYQCPSGQVMSGMYSVHDNGREDRQFRFYCCTLVLQ